MASIDPERTGTTLAVFFARGVLGLLTLMPGYHKVFVMGPLQHAEQLFLQGFQDSWIPTFLLLGLGVTIPFLELLIGVLLVSGLLTRVALVAEGCILLIVTYGHLLQEPFFDITTHIAPRLALLVFLLMIPRSADRLSLDHWLRSRGTASK